MYVHRGPCGCSYDLGDCSERFSSDPSVDTHRVGLDRPSPYNSDTTAYSDQVSALSLPYSWRNEHSPLLRFLSRHGNSATQAPPYFPALLALDGSETNIC